jgi:hypothetical protein
MLLFTSKSGQNFNRYVDKRTDRCDLHKRNRYWVLTRTTLLSLSMVYLSNVSWDSAVSIATGCGLDDRGVGVRVPVGSEFSLLHIAQTSSGAHPASYPMGTWGSFSGGKAAGVWSWPLTSS